MREPPVRPGRDSASAGGRQSCCGPSGSATEWKQQSPYQHAYSIALSPLDCGGMEKLGILVPPSKPILELLLENADLTMGIGKL